MSGFAKGNGPLARNILILCLINVVRLLVPLLVIPVLARTIAANDFGVYMYAISFSAWLVVFVEYGFNISSTREIASTSSKETILSVIAGTQSAKLLLTSATVPLLVMAIWWMPVFDGKVNWAIAAWLLGILMAFSPIYYFQGKENLRLVGITEALVGFITLVSVIFLIKKADDFYILPLVLLLSRGLGVVFLTVEMNKDSGMKTVFPFNPKSGLQMLKNGFGLFVFQAAVSLYTSFNVVFLGFFCPVRDVGAYASAEKLMRVGIGFIGQISTAIFPRLNAVRIEGRENLDRMRLRVLCAFSVIGILGVFVTWVISPWVVKYFFGGNLKEVHGILNIMAMLVPAIAISNVLGFQYLIVDRREKIFNVVIASAAIVNLVMAYLLVKHKGAEGMAMSWVLIEWMIAAALVVVVFAFKDESEKVTVE